MTKTVELKMCMDRSCASDEVIFNCGTIWPSRKE